jgi:acetylornithine deacetylase
MSPAEPPPRMPAGAPGAGARLGEAEQRALAALDHEGLLALLVRLVATPSLGGDESRAQRVVAEWLHEAGLATDVWQIDLAALAAHEQYSAEVERREALGVVGWVGESRGGRDLLLNGHVDVVPAGDEAAWATPPWEAVVRDGRVYGRGAADMKGGLCCALAAVRAIHDAGLRLRGRLSVASVVGEEDGGTGTLAMILRGYRADGAIIMEPTGLRVVPAQAGSLTFRLTVPGRAAHAATPDEGVSAIEKFMPLFAALHRLEAERCAAAHDPLFARYRLPWPLVITMVHAGDWASTVPASLVAEGRYGVAVGESSAAARREFEETIACAAAVDPWLREHPPAVEWWGGRFDPAATPVDDTIVTAMVDAVAAVAGQAPIVEGVTYGADLRLLVNVGGIPTVLCGPGDVRVAHMADEYVPVAELRLAAEALVLAAIRFCGVEA